MGTLQNLIKKNMHIEASRSDPKKTSRGSSFCERVMDIGNGEIEGIPATDGSDATWIQIPSDMLIDRSLEFKGLLDATYPSIQENFSDSLYLQGRAILAPANQLVTLMIKYLHPWRNPHILQC